MSHIFLNLRCPKSLECSLNELFIQTSWHLVVRTWFLIENVWKFSDFYWEWISIQKDYRQARTKAAPSPKLAGWSVQASGLIFQYQTGFLKWLVIRQNFQSYPISLTVIFFGIVKLIINLFGWRFIPYGYDFKSIPNL